VDLREPSRGASIADTGSFSDATTRKGGVRVDSSTGPGDNHTSVRYRMPNDRGGDAAIRVEESLATGFRLDALDDGTE
jgi:hypothetical protein